MTDKDTFTLNSCLVAGAEVMWLGSRRADLGTSEASWLDQQQRHQAQQGQQQQGQRQVEADERQARALAAADEKRQQEAEKQRRAAAEKQRQQEAEEKRKSATAAADRQRKAEKERREAEEKLLQQERREAEEKLQQQAEEKRKAEVASNSSVGRPIANWSYSLPRRYAVGRCSDARYKQLDEHALRCPKQSEGSIKSLVAYLVQPASAQGLRTGNYGDLSAEGMLRSRTGVCSGYSNLYLAMCKEAGVECVAVTGLAKGVSWQASGSVKKSNHAWNAVKLDSLGWALLDCTWAAGHLGAGDVHVQEYKEYYFHTCPCINHQPSTLKNLTVHVGTILGKQGSFMVPGQQDTLVLVLVPGQQDTLVLVLVMSTFKSTWAAGHLSAGDVHVQEYNDYYFLTRPDILIMDHLPTESDDAWALLPSAANVPTVQAYSEGVATKATYGWRPVSHTRADVHLPPGTTQIKLSFEYYAKRLGDMSANATKLTPQTSGAACTSALSSDGSQLTVCVTLPSSTSRVKKYGLEIEFCMQLGGGSYRPSSAKYSLHTAA
eukprot:gene31807-7006_t